MTRQQQRRIASLEGYQVSVALRDGSRIDDCQLISTGRNGVGSLWVYSNGVDTFPAIDDVVDLWETAPRRSSAA